MTTEKFCGTINHKEVIYTVYLENITDTVWVKKKSDQNFWSFDVEIK